MGLNKILKGDSDCLVLGNLDSQRDWGHARDYVYGMWLMMQQSNPDDYILSTNEVHSVREFVEKAFALKGFKIEWRGSGTSEVGIDSNTNRVLVKVSERYFRRAEVDFLLGDSTKAKRELGWEPKITFNTLVKEMVFSDCK
jgi:GDPmannose 4,6-dehydratase